jgi:hypothetical protein
MRVDFLMCVIIQIKNLKSLLLIDSQLDNLIKTNCLAPSNYQDGYLDNINEFLRLTFVSYSAKWRLYIIDAKYEPV